MCCDGDIFQRKNKCHMGASTVEQMSFEKKLLWRRCPQQLPTIKQMLRRWAIQWKVDDLRDHLFQWMSIKTILNRVNAHGGHLVLSRCLSGLFTIEQMPILLYSRTSLEPSSRQYMLMGHFFTSGLRGHLPSSVLHFQNFLKALLIF